MNASLAVNSDDLATMVIRLCRNGVCNTGSVESRPCATCPPRLSLQTTGPLDVSALLVPSESTTSTNDAGAPAVPSYSLFVRFGASTTAERDALKDGDVYSVRVAPADGGAPLLDVTKSVTYTKNYPNGPDCDGENGYCRSAAL